MDCKAFSKRHSAYIDDTLPGVERADVREHLASCARCAKRDAEVRRALLLLKNLPPIQVSDGFQDRLRERLAAESTPAPAPARRSSDFGITKLVAAAALLIAVVGVRNWPDSESVPTRLPAVFASAPVSDFGSVDESMPAYMASRSSTSRSGGFIFTFGSSERTASSVRTR